MREDLVRAEERSADGAVSESAGGPAARRTGLTLLAVLALAALLAPVVAPFDPSAAVAEPRLAPGLDGWPHILGTDRFGRDVLSRLLYGARVSLGVAAGSVAISTLVGTAVGVAAGYRGGLPDAAAMRIVDLFLSFPRIVLLVVAAAVLSPSLWTVILLLAVTGWMGTARLVRGEVLSVREREYVQSARAIGSSTGRILLRHVVPNALPPVLVASALAAADAILAEAALSFLGLGVQPPTPSWGGMIAGGRVAPLRAWWLIVFPGAAIALAVVAFNLSAEALRVRLAPGEEGGPDGRPAPPDREAA